MPASARPDRISDEVSAEELAHPESLAVHRVPVPPEEGGLWSPTRRSLTLGLVLTITLVASEALAVTTAMPIVARDLGGLELYGLVFSAFFIGSLIGIVLVGGLIDRVGVVVPFVGGLVLFAIGLAIGGLAPSMAVLVGARFLQGIGAGAIPPVAYVAIGRSLPEHLRPRMFAMLSTAWILPGVFGPAVAGSVAEFLNWRLVFLGLLPLIVVSGGIALRGLVSIAPADPGGAPGASIGRRLLEAIVLAVGLALLTAGLGSTNPPVAVALAVTGIAVTVLLLRRLTPAGTLTARRGYPTAILLRGVLTFAFFCVDVYVALLLVEVRGWSAAVAGIAITAATISWTAGSWTQARLSPRYRPEQFVRIGFPIVGLSLAAFGLVVFPAVPAWLAVPIFALAGLGMGLTYSQFALIVLRDVEPEVQGTGTAALTLTDVIGTAVGTGIAGAAVSAAVRAGVGPGPGIAGAVVIGAGMAFLGFLLSPRLRTALR